MTALQHPAVNAQLATVEVTGSWVESHVRSVLGHTARKIPAYTAFSFLGRYSGKYERLHPPPDGRVCSLHCLPSLSSRPANARASKACALRKIPVVFSCGRGVVSNGPQWSRSSLVTIYRTDSSLFYGLTLHCYCRGKNVHLVAPAIPRRISVPHLPLRAFSWG